MSENPTTSTPTATIEQTDGMLDIKVTFDLRDVLTAATGIETQWESDRAYPSGRIAEELLNRAAAKIATAHRYETSDAIRAAVHQAVYEQVKDTLTSAELFTSPGGKQASLRDMVLEAAQKWPNERTDSYGSGATRLQKLIQEQMAEMFRKELAPVVEAAKQEILAAIRAKAADMILAAAGDLNRAAGR